MGFEDPRAMAMVDVIAQACSSSSASRRTGRPRPSASWRSDTARPSRSVGGPGGPSPATVAGIAFNAQAVTVAAQIVAAEASGRAAGGPAVAGGAPGAGRRHRRRAWPAGCRPSECARTAGGPVALHRTVGRGRKPRHEAAAGGPAGMPALWGWAGPAPDGPAGSSVAGSLGDCQTGAVRRRQGGSSLRAATTWTRSRPIRSCRAHSAGNGAGLSGGRTGGSRMGRYSNLRRGIAQCADLISPLPWPTQTEARTPLEEGPRMPGVRDRNLRSGDLQEELGIFLLKAVALVAPVPRPEDVGNDAFATLIRPEGTRRLIPDLSFLVQLKSASVPSVSYTTPEEMAWIGA